MWCGQPSFWTEITQSYPLQITLGKGGSEAGFKGWDLSMGSPIVAQYEGLLSAHKMRARRGAVFPAFSPPWIRLEPSERLVNPKGTRRYEYR